MYQALYRKWRPRTFDDVVGQSHITDTLKRQVSGGRLSHAYLFTGTRGTGKTTCAKILARAVNCQNPQDGNPCNQCPACLGIENGSILDVLELDAASNNGVDQVRALRDEAVYTPAAVRKRVYIVDEVHMLSTPAFNALLKILEEPPAHLLFILATTELHKVPATIKSRCQQFSFKRILPGQIAQRLEYVAGQEGIELTAEGAALLARLADGGLRDALSLLDQCSGGGGRVDEQAILNTLGLAGNLETAALMERAARRDTAGALETLGRLYENGKDVGSVLGELSALARDLLPRKTAPRGCASLLTGGTTRGPCALWGNSSPPSGFCRCWSCCRRRGRSWPGAATAAQTRSCVSSGCVTRVWTPPLPGCPPGWPIWRSAWPAGPLYLRQPGPLPRRSTPHRRKERGRRRRALRPHPDPGRKTPHPGQWSPSDRRGPWSPKRKSRPGSRHSLGTRRRLRLKAAGKRSGPSGLPLRRDCGERCPPPSPLTSTIRPR